MYNITEDYGSKIRGDYDDLKENVDFIEGTAVGGVIGFISGGVGGAVKNVVGKLGAKIVSTGVGIVIGYAYEKSNSSPRDKNGAETTKKNILIAVAYVEKTRKDVSNSRFLEDTYLFKDIKNKNNLTMKDVWSVNSSLSNGSHTIKNVSELKERIKSYKEYEKTKNPDVYFKPRSLKLKVPKLIIQYTDIEEITSH